MNIHYLSLIKECNFAQNCFFEVVVNVLLDFVPNSIIPILPRQFSLSSSFILPRFLHSSLSLFPSLSFPLSLSPSFSLSHTHTILSFFIYYQRSATDPPHPDWLWKIIFSASQNPIWECCLIKLLIHFNEKNVFVNSKIGFDCLI